MKPNRDRDRFIHVAAALLGSVLYVSPASAQWTRVADVPVTRVFSVWSNRDTIVAGVDTTTYVSTNAGTTWKRGTRPVAGVVAIDAVRIRNGRLYVGTGGQGVFVSDDLGASWQAFNQGLVGGFMDSQLDVFDFEVRGDVLYAATLGAGVYERNLATPGTWQHFGDIFEPEQASNVNDVTLGGTRLLASAGSNGMVFFNDPGNPDWTESDLDNVGIHAGLQAYDAAWTGNGWVVGTLIGVFNSLGGQEPWSLTGLGIGAINWTAFATQGRQLFGAFDVTNGCVMEKSSDDGATWQVLEGLPSVFVFHLAISDNNLYAARADGLWRRSIGTVSVETAGAFDGLRFALAGPQPVHDQARLRFEMPAEGMASIEVFDVLGRQVAGQIEGSWSAGPHEVSLDTRGLAPGVYAARLTAGGTHGVVRIVHIQ